MYHNNKITAIIPNIIYIYTIIYILSMPRNACVQFSSSFCFEKPMTQAKQQSTATDLLTPIVFYPCLAFSMHFKNFEINRDCAVMCVLYISPFCLKKEKKVANPLSQFKWFATNTINNIIILDVHWIR